MKRVLSLFMSVLLVSMTIVGCSGGTSDGSNKEIAFANAQWDSVLFHNAVAGTIVEQVYGYSWTEIPGSSTVMHEGLLSGEIDVNMENWTDNLPTYSEDLEDGKFKELGINFDDNYQGFYVPKYVIEGDSERGIEPVAPDLTHVSDLEEHADIFPDDEDSSKGRIYGAIPGWEVDEIMHKKYQHYGLDENFVYFRPGSEASLSAALTSAYDKGEPIVAYYWEPTWLMGKYDFVLLEDEPYDAETYREGKTELPPVKVTVAASNKFAEENPQVIEFLSKYKTSSALTSEALAYMQDTGADYVETAEWFLKENDYLLDEWLDSEGAQIMRDYLSK